MFSYSGENLADSSAILCFVPPVGFLGGNLQHAKSLIVMHVAQSDFSRLQISL